MKKMYTQSELDEMRQLKRQGATYEEIARMFNRTAKAISIKFSELGWGGRSDKKDADVVSVVSESPAQTPRVKKPSLDDFTPREIIKYMYNLGYRIENNKLVYVHRQTINIKSILED